MSGSIFLVSDDFFAALKSVEAIRAPFEQMEAAESQIYWPSKVRQDARHTADQWQVTETAVWVTALVILLWRYSALPSLKIGLMHLADKKTVEHLVETVVNGSLTANLLLKNLGGHLKRQAVEDDIVEKLHIGLGRHAVDSQERPPLQLTLMRGAWEHETPVVLQFVQDSFPEVLARQLAGHWCEIVASLSSQPNACVHELHWISSAQLQHLNSYVVPGPEMQWERHSVIDMLDRWASERPGELAAIEEGKSFSWSALAQCTNTVAQALLALGIVRQAAIAVLLPQGLDWFCILLGIMRAGLVYVPLSRRNPAERQAYILDNSDIQTVITDNPQTLVAVTEARKLKLLHPAVLLSPVLGETKAIKPAALHDLAYIIYTSGSTGQPKGVTSSHANLSHFAQVVQQMYRLDALPFHLQFAEASFDMSIQDIFYAFPRGGTLVLKVRPTVFDFNELADYAQAQGVNSMTLPTAVWHEWHALIDQGLSRFPTSVQLLVIGGEAVRPMHFTTRSLAAGAKFYNGYGPTEATIYTTAQLCEQFNTLDAAGRVAIGRPFPNAEVAIVDAWGELVPPGVLGEIYIAGPCLSPGYHRRYDLNAQRYLFRPSPSSMKSGLPKRAYRSGDLAYWREDGQIVCTGRSDEQIKIRGMRVELGEIETCLARCLRVRHVAVFARHSADGEITLVAVLELNSGTLAESDRQDIEAIRLKLETQLPTYMVPRDLVIVEKMPFNTSGKIDRNAIQQEPATPWLAEKTNSICTSATDTEVQKIWNQVMPHLPSLGLDQDIWRDDVSSLKLALFFATLLSLHDSDVSIHLFAKARTLREVAALLTQASPENLITIAV